MPSVVWSNTWFLAALLLALLLGTNRASQDGDRRILPAAVNESYHSDSHALTICTLTQTDFAVAVQATSGEAESFLQAAAERLRNSVFSALPDNPEDVAVAPSNTSLVPLTTLKLQVHSPNTVLQHGVDESYTLQVEVLTDTAIAIVHSQTVFGALHGLETFSQLVEYGWTSQGERDNQFIFVIRKAPLVIQDWPYYPFRGLLIDTARHYLPVSLILHNLDAMSHNKLNVLHWHLTDSQSFPYVSSVYPELSQIGAFTPRHVYTREDIALVIHAAYLRGIRVIPELDTPGHVAALGKSHKELLTRCEESDTTSERPLDPTRPELYVFLEPLLHELSQLFPDSMLHMGGDEVGVDCWKASKEVQRWIREHGLHSESDVYEYFEKQMVDMVTEKCDKQPIVWQEVFHSVANLSNNVIIDVWKGFDADTMQKATSQNRSVILSGCWYLDHLSQSWKDFYSCKPWNFIGTAHQHSLVLGGKACMWGESVDASNFMSRVWPRASSMAELLWTGPSGQGDTSIERRMEQFRCYLLRHGIRSEPVSTGFCDKEPLSRSSRGQFRSIPSHVDAML